METDKSDVLAHYATKEDVQLVRVEVHSLMGEVKSLGVEMHALHGQAMSQMRAGLRVLRSDMQAFQSKMEAQMNALRSDLFAALNAQTWKMVGLVLTVNIATVTAVYYIAK